MRFAVTELAIPGVLLIAPQRFEDTRGAFMETYRASEYAALGIRTAFLQDNVAVSTLAGTIRGLHFQRPPHAQAKLVRVSRGALFDVAVDLRAGSPSYGRWVGALLRPDGKQLYIPRGFAHGYCTTEPDTEIAYKCDAYHAAGFEGGVSVADRALGIDWPVDPAKAVMSDRDRKLPMLSDIASPFAMELT